MTEWEFHLFRFYRNTGCWWVCVCEVTRFNPDSSRSLLAFGWARGEGSTLELFGVGL